jgi:hypothetical protein
MANHNHSFWSTAAPLIVSVTIMLGAGVPISAQADKEISLTEEQKIEIRKQEESALEKQDTAYREQARTMAEQYKRMAERVASQGGDPKPLLDAAAYFDNQSN